jgi:hypothetical protein
MEIHELRVGDRIEMHPATDVWMRGDRYGEIIRIGRTLITVKLDRSGHRRICPARSIYQVLEAPGHG